MANKGMAVLALGLFVLAAGMLMPTLIDSTNQNNEQLTIQTAENIVQTSNQSGSIWEAILLIGVAITLITISILYYKSQTPITK